VKRPPGKPAGNILDRLADKMLVGDGCWEWTSYKDRNGYGRVYAFKKPGNLAHRIVYELLAGPIPAGLTLDHECKNRGCVRPDHLKPMPLVDNVRRGVTANSLKTHCPRGHPYEGENLYVNSKGRRECRACWRVKRLRAKGAP
jgi:HNH endonuclease